MLLFRSSTSKKDQLLLQEEIGDKPKDRCCEVGTLSGTALAGLGWGLGIWATGSLASGGLFAIPGGLIVVGTLAANCRAPKTNYRIIESPKEMEIKTDPMATDQRTVSFRP